MAHPLANDPNVPECIRRAFARVEFQVVKHYDDGSEFEINVSDRAHADRVHAEQSAFIGRYAPELREEGGVMVKYRKQFVSLEIRAVA